MRQAGGQAGRHNAEISMQSCVMQAPQSAHGRPGSVPHTQAPTASARHFPCPAAQPAARLPCTRMYGVHACGHAQMRAVQLLASQEIATLTAAA